MLKVAHDDKKPEITPLLETVAKDATDAGENYLKTRRTDEKIRQ